MFTGLLIRLGIAIYLMVLIINGSSVYTTVVSLCVLIIKLPETSKQVFCRICSVTVGLFAL